MTKGERIRKLRDTVGLSQVELAQKIGVSKQTLYKYENDIITNIPSDKIESIARVCCSTPAYIMGWTKAEENALSAFNLLDSTDQARIMERIETMLEADKYRDNTRPAAGADPSIVASASGTASDASDSAGRSGTSAAGEDLQVTGESSGISSAAEQKADFPERFGENRSEQVEKRSKAAVRTSASDLDPDAAAQELRDHADRKMRLIQEKKA